MRIVKFGSLNSDRKGLTQPIMAAKAFSTAARAECLGWEDGFLIKNLNKTGEDVSFMQTADEDSDHRTAVVTTAAGETSIRSFRYGVRNGQLRLDPQHIASTSSARCVQRPSAFDIIPTRHEIAHALSSRLLRHQEIHHDQSLIY
jgi:sugar/nucleoside kinase (ribokinase family)